MATTTATTINTTPKGPLIPRAFPKKASTQVSQVAQILPQHATAVPLSPPSALATSVATSAATTPVATPATSVAPKVVPNAPKKFIMPVARKAKPIAFPNLEAVATPVPSVIAATPVEKVEISVLAMPSVIAAAEQEASKMEYRDLIESSSKLIGQGGAAAELALHMLAARAFGPVASNDDDDDDDSDDDIVVANVCDDDQLNAEVKKLDVEIKKLAEVKKLFDEKALAEEKKFAEEELVEEEKKFVEEKDNPMSKFQFALDSLNESELYYLLTFLGESLANNNTADLIFGELVKRKPGDRQVKANYDGFLNAIADGNLQDWRNCWVKPSTADAHGVSPMLKTIVTLLNYC